ncbi:MAG: hypothetical protein A3I39_01725 [Candidatus Yanofskybacteria bacterium RIFCSPLOWO2_02_FULL_47_9b]|uniref:Transcriptional repressor PaaX-like central Cas2-like domain-containing protein n=1 Tax=Candidatus Yanofskybacteria bacterium RIFCSPLOWO2_02_FULL_47_9b TaxID=1802708 RepID=A0A1F8H920_9BACT|nr:MAG: hypothetical protein A3I39_01725 [Candidatus Yanofskybacteria bacterium RIFCSPLOWO2_02_FULL_47_9b]
MLGKQGNKRNGVSKAILERIYQTKYFDIPNLLNDILSLPQTLSKLQTNRRYYTKNTLQRFIDDGLVEFVLSKNSRKYLCLTKDGMKRLNRYRFDDYKIDKPFLWDGKWRLIIFDIKEIRRGDRNLMRHMLGEMGFKRLQNSVWVHPYGCEEMLNLLKINLGLNRDVLYLVVEKLENDKWLRSEFEL